MTADLSAYLQRIKYSGPIRQDFETMRALHRAHLHEIPYENFDVQLKRPITSDPHAAFDKIVNRGRGGWCYEMNGTFGLALQAAGFNVTRLASDGTDPASHLVLVVDLDGEPFVCDVGFADGPPDPYPLAEGPFTQDGFEFRLEFLPDGLWRVHNHRFGAAANFTAGTPDEAALATRCHALQTEPTSQFVQNTITFRRTSEGVISLIGRVLRTITPEAVTRITIASADEYVATLKSRFALDLPETASLWPVICERHEAYMAALAARRAAAEQAQ